MRDNCRLRLRDGIQSPSRSHKRINRVPRRSRRLRRPAAVRAGAREQASARAEGRPAGARVLAAGVPRRACGERPVRGAGLPRDLVGQPHLGRASVPHRRWLPDAPPVLQVHSHLPRAGERVALPAPPARPSSGRTMESGPGRRPHRRLQPGLDRGDAPRPQAQPAPLSKAAVPAKASWGASREEAVPSDRGPVPRAGVRSAVAPGQTRDRRSAAAAEEGLSVRAAERSSREYSTGEAAAERTHCSSPIRTGSRSTCRYCGASRSRGALPSAKEERP